MAAFFTIGHSNRQIGSFLDLLRESNIRLVADVRAIPRSRSNPEYNSDVLPQSLSAFQIAYEHIPALGGRRRRQNDVPAAANAFWENESFHNYADYALSDGFQSGLKTLLELGHAQPCGIMCAEAVWWRCHRRIITDYLIAGGETVFHILGAGRIEQAHMTDAAELGPAGTLTYPLPEQP